MKISLDELDVDIIESTPDNEDAYNGRWGWYWHEAHEKLRGPFTDPATAVFDLAEWIKRRYVEPPPPPTGDRALAGLFLQTACGFLDSAEADRDGEVGLASCCYALELILKSYLLSRGFSDAWNAEHVRHDLACGYALATHHGLPDDDARIDQFIRAVNAAFTVHDLLRLHGEQPDLVARYEAITALRSLAREVERRGP
jgi:hypothetical protein